MKTVKEISELTGISIRTLRYYDEIGLLIPTMRSDAGYRLYDEKALEKLNAIIFLRELDMPLNSIKDIVNSTEVDYGIVLKDYRKNLVQKIRRLQGLLNLVESIETGEKPIAFRKFTETDADQVAQALVNGQDMKNTSAVSEMYELVKKNMVDGKVGNELLQIYGSKEKYLSAVEESGLHPEMMEELREELKTIYFAFRDISEDCMEAQELVKRLENNTKNMFRTENARFILLKIAEDYLRNRKNAQVIDHVYGMGVTKNIGKAIHAYYGV